MASKITRPRSLADAERLASVYALVDYEIGEIEAERDAAIAALNGAADEDLVPLVAQAREIEAALAGWWERSGSELTGGTRKSIELGGCVIGTRKGKAKLVLTGTTADAIVAELRAVRWGKPFVREKFELDKAAAMKGLEGKHGDALRALGVGCDSGAETFFIERTRQAGTQGKVARRPGAAR